MMRRTEFRFSFIALREKTNIGAATLWPAQNIIAAEQNML
jgi:hypothetical protein